VGGSWVKHQEERSDKTGVLAYVVRSEEGVVMIGKTTCHCIHCRKKSKKPKLRTNIIP